MKNPTIQFLKCAALFSLVIPHLGGQTVYTEDFTDFIAGVQYTKGTAFYTLLHDGDDNAFWDPNLSSGTNNVKPLDYAGSTTSFSWGTTSATPDRFFAETLKPQLGGNTDYKGVGVFLPPSVFTAGSGTYQLSYDIVGVDATSEERAAAIQIATFLGIGNDAANTVGFDLAGATLFNDTTSYPSVTESRFRTQGTATLVNYFSQSVDTTATGTFTMNFTYSEGETVGLIFIGFATDVEFDNLSISVATESTSWAGFSKREDNYVDTDGFLGWIRVSDASDYIWSVSLSKYIYLPEGFVSDSGAWTYVPK
jgi:hypothetical protein